MSNDLRCLPAEGGPFANEAVRRHISDGLRLYLGMGRRYSVRAVAEATQIPLDSLRDYVDGSSAPGTGALLRLMSVLPLGFSDHVLSLAGLQAAARIGREQDDHGLLADVIQAAMQLGEALRDGRIDHVERRTLVPRLRELIPVLVQFCDREAP